MILMVLVVICYTITSLNDKYAVSPLNTKHALSKIAIEFSRHIVLYDIHPALSGQNF